MEFAEVIRRRRMVRDFDDERVAPEALERILAAGRRGPSAGFTQGVDLLVLEGTAETNRYWNASLPPDRRAGFRWPGLLRAPVLVVVLADKDAYLGRYAEPDKRSSDQSGSRWPVPYWTVDASFAAMLLLLAAVDEGLGALFFAVAHPQDVMAALGVPHDLQAIGTVALGHPSGRDRPSSSSRRPRRAAEEAVHRGSW